MSLKNGVIKAGTVVYKKVRVFVQKEQDVDGYVDNYGSKEKFDPDNDWHYNRAKTPFAVVKLITLEDGIIPKKHRRGTQTNNNWEDGFRKCRVPKAYVAEIIPPLPDDKHVAAGRGFFKYELGKVVTPDSWDDSQTRVCTNGIHVFLTQDEAERYSV